MKKKLVTLLLAASMVMGLVACGNEDTPATSEKTSAASEKTSAASDEAPAEGEIKNFNAEGYPIVDEEITLKVMLMMG